MTGGEAETTGKPTEEEKINSAADLMGKIDAKMESLKSYQSDLTVEIKTKIQGMNCEATMTGLMIELEDYYYEMMEGTTVIKMGSLLGTDITMKTKELEAFYNGRMFVWKEQDDVTQKVYSSLTAAEYKEYSEKQEDDLDIDYNECVNSNFEQNEDKSWTLTYSGYTKKVINKMVKAFGEDLFEEEIVDMEITIHANEDFTAKDIEIKMIFEDTATSSWFTMFMQYSKYDEATAITDTLNLAEYQEIADCRLLKEFEDMFEDLEDAENVSFTLNLEQKMTAEYLNFEQIYNETDNVTYGKKEGKYFYNATASYDDGEMKIVYENGNQTVTVDGEPFTVPQTEQEAKEFVGGLINAAQYESIRVSHIEKIGDGVYAITYGKPDDALYGELFESLNIHSLDIVPSHTIVITVQDGKLVKVESELKAEAPYMGRMVTFSLSSVNIFTYPDNNVVC